MLQQLQEQRGLLGNVVEHLSVLRDIELVSQELKQLKVSRRRASHHVWFMREAVSARLIRGLELVSHKEQANELAF